MKIVTTNRKAGFNYHFLDKLECGIKLVGSEVKSIRKGSINLNDSYATIRDGEVFLLNMYIAAYEKGSHYNAEERRVRKLLLKKQQINKLADKVAQKGFALVPTKVYFKDALVKVEIALAKGKHTYDKKNVIKDRDVKRDMDRQIREAKK